ncbi:MAG: helix-turn-helix domain-containing protein [Bifidobacteriales bacterium]|nr:helix-turn-helix domain-containing protein [Bifidobacteriales bacterium]
MNDKKPEEPAMMTVKEVAAMLRVSTVTLGKWRRAGKGPKAIKLGYNKVVYSEKAVRAWLKDKEDGVC